jgi:hypothetical protein
MPSEMKARFDDLYSGLTSIGNFENLRKMRRYSVDTIMKLKPSTKAQETISHMMVGERLNSIKAESKGFETTLREARQFLAEYEATLRRGDQAKG